MNATLAEIQIEAEQLANQAFNMSAEQVDQAKDSLTSQAFAAKTFTDDEGEFNALLGMIGGIGG